MARKPRGKTPTQEIDELLGTKDKKEQVEHIRKLTNPVIDVIIRFDARMGLVSQIVPIGGKLGMEDAKWVLQQGIDFLTRQQMAAEMNPNQTPPGSVISREEFEQATQIDHDSGED